ncbi:MAG: S41 family peptidase [Deltaproteobacteria bacterium]|nr:S41 family peptidase [Deltaproteobacteria bacterium]
MPTLLGGVALGLVAGLVLGAATSARSRDADISYRKLRVFSQVFNYVENNYVASVDQEQLVYGAIKGLLSTLDPHTAFLPPSVYQKLKQDTTGEFGGLGIELGLKDGWLTIIAPVADSPAAKAGLKAGDRIVAVEGTSSEGMKIEDAVALLRGAPGTKVTITVVRDSWDGPREVLLVRQRLHLNPIDHRMLEPGYGYVRIKSFQERTERNLRQALDDLTRQARLAGRESLAGLVLDLRDNPGGLVEEAVKVADLFLTGGDIVTTEGRNQRNVDRQSAHLRGTQPGYPLIALVNEGSASASEILAGALQDRRRAVVMGTTTFGKGSVQTIIELEDGSGLKLTVARYFTPNGRSIQEGGIEPDIRIEQPAEEEQLDVRIDGSLRERDLPGHLEAPGGRAADSRPAVAEGDPQLRTALEYLKAAEVFVHGSGPVRDVSRR